MQRTTAQLGKSFACNGYVLKAGKELHMKFFTLRIRRDDDCQVNLLFFERLNGGWRSKAGNLKPNFRITLPKGTKKMKQPMVQRHLTGADAHQTFLQVFALIHLL